MTDPRRCVTFHMDLASALAAGARPETHQDRFGRCDAEALLAAYERLVPQAPPLDPLRQAHLLADDRLVSETELAERLGVSLSRLQHWRSENRGPPFYKFGAGRRAAVRYCWFEVLIWLRATFWVRPAQPILPVRTAYRAGRQAPWEYADPADPAGDVAVDRVAPSAGAPDLTALDLLPPDPTALKEAEEWLAGLDRRAPDPAALSALSSPP